MPHTRPRHLEFLIKKTLRFSPIVGIFGHRQVGKTTLASALAQKYATLDRPEEVSQAQADPAGFLTIHQGAPLVIDECQLAPALFPALKEWVRIHPTPGQFLLTGSVRFSSRKAIRESLTGRLVAWELLPMDWSEMHGTPLPDTILRSLRSPGSGARKGAISPHPAYSERSYQLALGNGGLPGVFAVRDAAIRAQRFETQINTILERDLRLLLETPLSYRILRELLVALARQAGGSLEMQELQRAVKLSLPTLRKLIPVLEALFMIRLIPSEGDYSKPVLFFEDLGEQRYLKGKTEEDTEANTLLPFLYHHLRGQFHYRPELQGEIFAYRDRKSATPALGFRCEHGTLGVFPALSAERVPEQLQSAQRFLGRYPGAQVWIVTPQDQDQLVAEGVRWLGLGRVLGGVN